MICFWKIEFKQRRSNFFHFSLGKKKFFFISSHKINPKNLFSFSYMNEISVFPNQNYFFPIKVRNDSESSQIERRRKNQKKNFRANFSNNPQALDWFEFVFEEYFSGTYLKLIIKKSWKSWKLPQLWDFSYKCRISVIS